MQSTAKRTDLAYNSFFKGLRGLPKFKSIRNYSGWTYSSKSGWKVNTDGKHGTITLNDLGVTLKMRGQAKSWGVPTTLTLVYKPSKKHWFASFTCNIDVKEPKFGSLSALNYESLVAFDLGTATAITCFDGTEFEEISNPRFTQAVEEKVKQQSKKLRKRRAPGSGEPRRSEGTSANSSSRNKGTKASRRWKKARKVVSKLQRQVANQRKDWQHKVTSDIASRYDIGVTEKLNTKGMTRKAPKDSKRKRQKAGLNKSMLSVGFGTLNQMIAYKIEVNAKIHHRSNKPEVTPTILKLIQIGIAHIESNLPVADESVTDELKKQISDLDTRLKAVESKLSGVKNRQ